MTEANYRVYMRTSGKTKFESHVQKTVTIKARSEIEAFSLAQARYEGFTVYHVERA
jgi:hypothetical protein